MASTPRAIPFDPLDLNKLERLIFAQAVYELGSGAWPGVSQILSDHPLLSRPKNFFTPESCQEIYLHLMDDAGLESSDVDLMARRGTSNLKLARHMYEARLLEIRELIAAEEVRFKTVVAEIDAIRSGTWDDRIKTDLGLNASGPDEPLSNETEQLESNQFVGEDATTSQEVSPPSPLVQHEEPLLEADDTKQADMQIIEPIEPNLVQEVGDLRETSEARGQPEISANVQPIEDATMVEPTTDEDHTLDSPIPEIATSPLDTSQQGGALSVETKADDPDPSLETGSHYENVPSLEHERDIETETARVSPGVGLIQAFVETEARTPELPSDEADKADQIPRDSKRKASEVDSIESQREKKKAREDSQVAEDDDGTMNAGPSRRRLTRAPNHETTQAVKKFQSVIIMLHSQISQHRNGNIFHNPIKNSEAPDYHEIVKRPMDLKTIKTRIKDGAISNSAEFQRDVYLMFANSMMYNRPKSDIYNMAEEMMLESEVQINSFRQTEGFIRGGHRL
ncbi:hypothetical protein HETIRDRAFT_472349 [Heterobasidion irregulare TC 32-1]|uniref:Bromo domain-containing protein n=1 Tax=Heterobasidion irregulare (strain TC 32-1) TaxID=747525 RepID=W4KDQ3_HETIT|nr:uncharacterized protein HETIRDRAFT_472349 [Heterobasidion irregulare TC 32-1]ETW83982.1 hypothetical protein HETIRDRAFT_472349 [Heterobasidion irregulare TC 32-1]